VTTLRVAEKFEQSYLSSPEISRLVDAAKVFYVEGYFLTHGADIVLELAKKATNAGKVGPYLLLVNYPLLLDVTGFCS